MNKLISYRIVSTFIFILGIKNNLIRYYIWELRIILIYYYIWELRINLIHYCIWELIQDS
jgi:hypothetical protein